MEKVTVTIGITENNYSAHLEIGDGIVVATEKTFEGLKKQMKEAVEFHLEGMREDNDEIPSAFLGEYELVYHFDPQSLLQRYAFGVSKPRKEQAKKIENALHALGRELLVVEL